MAIYPKGLDILIQGFSYFHKLHPNSQLILIGDGKDKSKLQQLSKELGIENAVDFTGGLFGDEKVKKLKECHVFAHPSRTDGLPATIVEAASLGIPCVVSDATNTGGYIAKYDAGYYMEKLDAEEFSNGLQNMYKRIIDHNEGAKLQSNSIKMITEAFDWELILKKFNDIYSQALRSSKDKSQVSSIISMI
jgi:glycosyltransferase involved in cell wall biosynthesis